MALLVSGGLILYTVPMKYTTLLGLGLTTLIALGAGCASTDTNTNTVTTDDADTTLLVPVDSDSDVEEIVVVDDEIGEETEEVTEEDVEETEADGEEDTEEEDVEEIVTAPTTQTFDIVAQQFEFSPSSVTVNVGDTVVLNLTTNDVPHGFSLSQFGVSTTITPGQTKTVEFVADEAGTFTFTCSVVCGAGHSGMSGQIIVQ